MIKILKDHNFLECQTKNDSRKNIFLNLKQNDNFEYLLVDGGIILKYINKKYYEVAWTGLIWLRIGTCGLF
jgi:uncharacterized membrane protein